MSTKESLLSEIEKMHLPDVDLSKILIPTPTININELLIILAKKTVENCQQQLIVDVRSPSEWQTDGVPFSINIPILDDQERKKVGTIYKQLSEQLATNLAYYYAKEKEETYLKEFEKFTDRDIIIYCWRGGGRSRYVTSLLQCHSIASKRLEEGQKKYRQQVHQSLYLDNFEMITLSGLTGVGKSEILEQLQMSSDIPILHLEECAHHASSVFGEIRFLNKTDRPPTNQAHFENNIFLSLLPHIIDCNSPPPPLFLGEDESRKIGKFLVPPSIMNAISTERHIEIRAPLINRARRCYTDYFDNNNPENIKLIKEKVRLLKRRLGENKINQYLNLIDSGNFSEFLQDILENYYDQCYRIPRTSPLTIIENLDSLTTSKRIETIFKEIKR